MNEFSFPSTGDADKDKRLADQIRKHDRNMFEGMCPNGCAPLEWDDPHNSNCPICKFHLWTNVPYNGLEVK